MNRMGLVLIVTLAAGCDSTRSPTAPSSPSLSPTPAPQGPNYSISGVVVDADTGRPIENASVIVRFDQGHLTARTAADGTYAFSFETSQPYRERFWPDAPDILGLLIVLRPDMSAWRSSHWTAVQEIPRGPSQMTQNVRLRPVRTIAAGESMALSIEADSSLVWDQEWDPWQFVTFGRVWQEFLVSPGRVGVLTIDVRSENGGSVPFLACQYVGCPDWLVQGPVSIPVGPPGPLYFSIQIPRGTAPQRYVITTSLK